jgi:hypothetical protein
MFDFIIKFLDKQTISARDAIVITVIGGLILFISIEVFKKIYNSLGHIIKKFLKYVIVLYKKFKSYCQKKYRKIKGILTLNEYIDLTEKKNSGGYITLKELHLLEKNNIKFKNCSFPLFSREKRKEIEEAMKNFKMDDNFLLNNINYKTNLPNLQNFNNDKKK